ncbi:hypothetical protein [Oceanobacillus salinisoli]|uniref:hypothetical protein n=1 Tax=Oceanobacillus salinisoli TaxID=2678611 RepID=UPI0012E21A53|nr:hypothetical protein [Oceanobacillus salinisoli]
MENKYNRGLSLTLALISGISATLLGRNYIVKHQDGNFVLRKLKAVERKVYLDGKKRADILKDIKQDLDNK